MTAMTADSRKNTSGGRPRFYRIATVIGILLCVALIPLLAVNITLIAKSFIHPEEVPDFMGYKPFIVLSGSMEPAVMTGDLVITQEVDPASLQAGDVIAYRYGDSSIITHRIREVTQKDGLRAFITKGDANNVDDNVMPTEDLVEGRLRWTVPGLGNAAMFLQTPGGLLLAAGSPVLLFILIDTLRRRRADKTEQKKSSLLEEELARVKQQLASAEPPAGEGEGGENIS